MENKERLLKLDALRGIAAIIVVLYHYTYRYFEISQIDNPLPFTLKFGHLGVELFFIISGFVITMSIKNITSYRIFLLKRFIRLYPTYWIAGIITFSFLLMFPLEGRTVNITDALLNIMMLQEHFNIPHIDGVYWSLTIELSFYFIIALILLSNKKEWITELLTALLIALFIYHLIMPESTVLFERTLLSKHINLFLFGVILYMKYKQQISPYKYFTVLIVCVIFEIVIIPWGIAKFVLLFFALLHMVIHYRFSRLENKVLLFLGNISYPLYLVHQNIGYSIIFHLNNYNFNIYISIALTLLIVISIAFILHYFVENKFTSWLQQKTLF